MKSFIYVLIFLFVAPLARAGEQAKPDLCPELMMYWTPQVALYMVRAEYPRLELRACPNGELQLSSWEARATAPRFTLDTNGEAIEQVAMSGKLAVFVFAGGNRSRLFALTFDHLWPVVALKDNTVGPVRMQIRYQEVEVSYPGPDGKEKRAVFPTGNQLVAGASSSSK